MVVQVIGVRHGFQQPAPLVERDFRAPAVPDARPCFRFLRRELDGHAVMRSGFDARACRADDAMVIASRQGDPRPDLVRPRFDLGMISFSPERQRSLAGGLGRLPVAGVIFDARDQQGDPARKRQDLAVLIQREALALEGADPAQPRPALHQELVARHERILRAQPVGHDPQCVDGGLIQVRSLQAADQLQGVHAGDGQDVGVGIALRRHREHRVRDRAERRCDDRLVQRLSPTAVRLDLARFPALVLPQQAGAVR